MAENTATLPPIILPVLLDGSKIKSQLAGIANSIKGNAGLVGGSVLRGLGWGSLLGVGSAAGAIGAFVAIRREASQAEQATFRLAQALEMSGVKASAALPKLMAFSQQMQRTTTFSSEAVQSMMATGMLRGIRPDQIEKTTQAAIGFSAAGYGSPESVMTMMSRARYGDTRMARRLGINTKGKSVEDIQQAMTEKGVKFQPMAEAQTNTLEGSMAQLKNVTDDVVKAFGVELIPVILALTKWMNKNITGAEGWAAKAGRWGAETVQGLTTEGGTEQGYYRPETRAEILKRLKNLPERGAVGGFFAGLFGENRSKEPQQVWQTVAANAGSVASDKGKTWPQLLKEEQDKVKMRKTIVEDRTVQDRLMMQEQVEGFVEDIFKESREEQKTKKGAADWRKSPIALEREAALAKLVAAQGGYQAAYTRYAGGSEQSLFGKSVATGKMTAAQKEYDETMAGLKDKYAYDLKLYTATEKQKTLIGLQEARNRMLQGTNDPKEKKRIQDLYKSQLMERAQLWAIESARMDLPVSNMAPLIEYGSAEAYALKNTDRASEALDMKEAQIKTELHTKDMNAVLQDFKLQGITIKGLEVVQMK
jgi:hypothetical protein